MKQSAGEITRERILKAGVKLWPSFSISDVAAEADLTHPAVLYHFPNGTLKDAVAEYAVATGVSKIIVQLMGEQHPAAKKLSAADRIRHFNAIDEAH